MTKTNFTRKAVVALSAIMAIAAIPSAFMAYGDGSIAEPVENPLEPYCLVVTANTDATIPDAQYVGEAIYTDKDGNKHNRGTFGFNFKVKNVSEDVYDENGNYVTTKIETKITSLYLKGMKVGEDVENIYLPDQIAFDYNGNGEYLTSTLTNIVFNYYTPEQGYTESNSFVDSPSLKHVYVGPSATSVTWYGEDFFKLRNFHFRSEDVPNFRFYEGANGKVNIYVPETLFENYASVMEGADYTATVWSESPASPTNVNVDIPGTLADAISSNIENLNSVRWLVVTGTPNEQDLRIMRRLPRLEILDLSATTGLNTMVGCNGLKYLREVKLPEGVTQIGEKAFYQCTALESVKLPSTLESIGRSSFSDCYSLFEIQLPSSTKRIENEAFSHSGLKSINLENVEEIGSMSFYSTSLKSINLESARVIWDYAFQCCRSLTAVNFGAVERIYYAAFNECDLRKVVLPNSCRDISSSVFDYNYNLKEIELGNGLEYINTNAFPDCVEKVTITTLFPTEGSGFGVNDLPNTLLYVPALTLNEYLLADGWTMFRNDNIKPIEEDLTDVTIYRTFMLTSDRGVANNATMRLYRESYDYYGNTSANYGHLSVRRNVKAPLNLGKYYQAGRKSSGQYWDNNGSYYYRTSYDGSTLIPYSEITADEVELKLTMETGKWHFISLPFDVNVSDIKVTKEALWVVRKYSGADRAALNESTWQNMTDETVLRAGQGYIFHCSLDNSSEVEFTFKPTSTAEGNKLFAKEDVVKQLAEYPSEFAHNASWNLVGNTFPAYFNIRALGFDAPVTLYNGNTYTAYSPLDDNMVLEPFQAFFVQRLDTEGGDVITFHPDGRAHFKEEAEALEIERKKAPAVTRAAATRSLFNIHINGETGSDRARVVVNENASMAYEKNCDASKFMSSEKEVPQIFVMNSNRRMAIDERPLGDGEITLGAYFGKSGEYTISLDTRNAEEYTVWLIDNKTGVTTDLTAGDYTFQADAATDENRFRLMLNGKSTAADAITADATSVNVDGNVLTIAAPAEIEIAVASADGKIVASDFAARFTAVLEKGIYVVKAGNLTKKVIIAQ